MLDLYDECSKVECGMVKFQHLYETYGFDIDRKFTEDSKEYRPFRYHSCLKFGHWCWKNALENPKMAIKFIIYKLKNCASKRTDVDKKR